MSGVIEDEPVAKSLNVNPSGQIINPSSGKIQNIYKNIENEPLINTIKTTEAKLEILEGEQSVELDIDEAENPDIENSTSGLNKEQKRASERDILNELLLDFKSLLKTPYGPLGYLVMSESEQIRKLYGVDTDQDFLCMVEGSKIRITSPKDKKLFNVEKMVVAGGGKRWMGEAGSTIIDPAETQSNEKFADEAIQEIIGSIENKLSV